MNTTLTEHTTDEIEELRKDYYEEYYPSPRIEKAIFNYLDQDYYAGEDDVFYTIYKKENDWFVNREDVQKEIEKMFGLTLPERIKVGPNEDDYIQPARNPIPGRVIHKWIVKHQLGLRADDIDKDIDDIAEDLEYWGFDGKEIGPLKEQVNPKLINKFLNGFWPQHRNQVYSKLYKTYHPSTYTEGFTRPSSNFENALETIADAVHEGKKLGLIDSTVDWSDIVHYDDYNHSTSDLRVIDDDGVPTLNNQLEIMDNTNLDWIHGILLFDVLEDIVEEFRCYCGESGIDPNCEGKCMDEFPPQDGYGTLKQDYYTLYNFMKELERAGIPVAEYMKSPLYPNIIKLKDTGTTDYDTTGEYSPMRQDSETMDVEEILMDVPERMSEQDFTLDKKAKELEIKRIEDEIDTNKKIIKNMEVDLKKLDPGPKYGPLSKQKDDKDKPAVIGIGTAYYAEQNNPEGESGETTGSTGFKDFKIDTEPDAKSKELEKSVTQGNIDFKKKQNKDLETQLKNLKTPEPIDSDSTKAMAKGGDGETTGTIKPLKVDKVVKDLSPDEKSKIGKDYLSEHDDAEDGAERLYKKYALDNEEYVDDSPFTRKEILILKQLHKNLTRGELQSVAEDTPTGYGTPDKKFWQVMKLFGIEHSRDVADDTRSSIYAKWALDNWTEDGDYGSIEQPIKAPLKWYEVDRAETGSQIEYKDGTAEVLGFDEDDAGNRADSDFYSWGGDMETTDYGDYESYDSSIDRVEFKNLDEQKEKKLLNEIEINIKGVQTALSGLGFFFPPADGLNAILSFIQKDFVGGILNLVAIIPGPGDLAKAVLGPLFKIIPAATIFKIISKGDDAALEVIKKGRENPKIFRKVLDWVKGGKDEIIAFIDPIMDALKDLPDLVKKAMPKDWPPTLLNNLTNLKQFFIKLASTEIEDILANVAVSTTANQFNEQIDPELKYTIDQQYRTNPEMRDELLQSLDDEGEGKYYLNPEGTELNVPPIKIAQKFSEVNGYGNIKFDMQGGNGIAYFTDKGLVIKLTTDESEYFTANKLVGTDNEYIVKVFESAIIKTSHTINDDLFVIVLEALPMTEEIEKTWSECCCGKDSPVHIDYLVEPVLVLPPVSDQDKCLPIYDNIVSIQKNFAQYDIVWSDIGIDNMGIKNGKLAVIDLGETRGGTTKGEEVTLNLENVKIRPLTKKQIQKQLVLI
jgi:hypothetical protein